MPLPLFDPNDVIRIHETAMEYAIRVQQAAAHEDEQRTTNLVARAALYTLAHETVCLHRSIWDLCLKGWAFAAPILLRSMLEAMLSTVVIVNSNQPDVAAFKYFYAYTKENLIDPSVDPQLTAAQTQANINTHLAQMTAGDQKLAKAYLRARKAGHFWYSDQFRGPTGIIKKYSIGEVLDLYKLLSIATHAGFLGMRMFRDNPDFHDVNPRKDPRAMGFAMVSSSRLLAEATRARVMFANLQDTGYDAIMGMIHALRPVG